MAARVAIALALAPAMDLATSAATLADENCQLSCMAAARRARGQ
jgi:hypothetical protein